MANMEPSVWFKLYMVQIIFWLKLKKISMSQQFRGYLYLYDLYQIVININNVISEEQKDQTTEKA